MGMEQEADPQQFEIYPNRCLENGKKMYLNEHTADVRFLFGEKDNVTSIPAHKVILATDSDVFERMFYGELKEPGDIHVPDSTEAAFKEFLQYFYLDKVKLTAENMVDVLYLGAKYNVKKCFENCIQSFTRSLDDENVCDQLNLAILYDQKEWIAVCEKHIMVHTEAVFDSVEFLKSDKMALAHILKMDVLACNEIDVFKACMSWVKANCDPSTDLSVELVERHLGKSFYDIRLASLTMDQLSALNAQYESALARDFIYITHIMVLPEFPESKFNKNPRHAKWNAKAIVKFLRKIDYYEEHMEHREYHYYRGDDNADDETDSDSESESYAYHLGCCVYHCGFYDEYDRYGDEFLRQLDTTEDTTFSVSDPLFLGSLSCIWYGINIHDVKIELEIIEARDLAGVNCNTLLKIKVNYAKDISLPHPVLIRPGYFYTIRLGPFPKDINYHCRDLKKKVKHKSNMDLEFHKNFEYSLVDGLNFNKI